MLQHAREQHHHFRKDDVSVLATEHDWVRRGIKEAIYIKALAPSINIDPGRHTLSTHFDSILSSNIPTPPTPAPHNPEAETLINTAPRRQGRPRKEPTLGPIQLRPHSPQQQQQDPQQQQQDSQQQDNPITLPKTITPIFSQPQRQSQRLRARQQQQQQQQQQQPQQQQQLTSAEMRSQGSPPAAP